MEPQIRYARTSDGVSIAYYTLGSGLPYVWPATPQGAGLGETWRVREWRELAEHIASRATLVMYEPRGFGLADRGVMDYSLGAMVRDMEAVVDVAAPGAFTLQTFNYMSVPALAYAARHPERVAALVLLNPVVRGSDTAPSWNSLVRLAHEDWDYAKTLLVRTNEAAYSSTTTLQQLESIFDHAVTRDAFLSFCEAMRGWDASELAPEVETPTLVAHYGAQSTHIPPEASRRLAATLPHATFAFAEPASGESQLDRASSIVRSFLRDVLPRPERDTRLPASSRMAVVLFTDIADSTALTERLGDAAFRAASRALDTALRAAVREAGGTPVAGTVLGDGVMGVFASAAQAIDAARRCLELSTENELGLHIGLHAGDVIREADNVYGGAVNIAARVCALSMPGEVLVSQTVRDLARTSAGVVFEDRGEQRLKGIEDAVRVFAVRHA